MAALLPRRLSWLIAFVLVLSLVAAPAALAAEAPKSVTVAISEDYPPSARWTARDAPGAGWWTSGAFGPQRPASRSSSYPPPLPKPSNWWARAKWMCTAAAFTTSSGPSTWTTWVPCAGPAAPFSSAKACFENCHHQTIFQGQRGHTAPLEKVWITNHFPRAFPDRTRPGPSRGRRRNLGGYARLSVSTGPASRSRPTIRLTKAPRKEPSN